MQNSVRLKSFELVARDIADVDINLLLMHCHWALAGRTDPVIGNWCCRPGKGLLP